MEEQEAEEILGSNFVGSGRLAEITGGFALSIPAGIPGIPFDRETLLNRRNSHLLLLCLSNFSDGTDITIRSMKEKIAVLGGTPRFYNQDWYLKESFIDKSLETKWLLVSKTVLDGSRAMSADEIITRYRLHSAVELTFAFFANYFVTGGEKLWDNDYVWCSDVDDKGDQIYVGRYTDASGLNADGFEIHRHLRIKRNYGVV